MPAIRDILIHISAETSIKERKCGRGKKKKEKIPRGSLCLVVKGGPMNTPQSYCVEHAKPMLDGAWKKLGEVYAFLKLTPPTTD